MSTLYPVSHSQSVLDQIRLLADKARRYGRERELGMAFKWIMEELERTPLEFGEARYASGDPGMKIRVGFSGPVMVRFGVHEESRQVFIARVRGKF